MGIGVDALPESIRNSSSVLTGNDLGILGNSRKNTFRRRSKGICKNGN